MGSAFPLRSLRSLAANQVHFGGLIRAREISALAERPVCRYRSSMSSVANIETAIQRLSPAEVAELASWLEEYQQMISASAEMFALYDREESD